MDQSTQQTINLLQGNQIPYPQVVPVPKVDQTQILKKAIKPRHLETGLFAIHVGNEVDLPDDGSVYPFFMANDTLKLYFWNGSSWSSVQFA